ncbi:MAG: hypothetical protein U0936_20905 [Planctomycetaceae bacterium]
MTGLRVAVRTRTGRSEEPSVACIDSQTAKTADQEARSDTTEASVRMAGKDMCDDVMGLILVVCVTAANVHDAVAADPLLRQLNQIYPDSRTCAC